MRLTNIWLQLVLFIIITPGQAMAVDAPQFTCKISYEVWDQSRWEEEGICPKTMHMTCRIEAEKAISQNTDFRRYQELDFESVQLNISIVLYNDLLVNDKRAMVVRIHKKHKERAPRGLYRKNPIRQEFYIDQSSTGKVLNISFPIDGKQSNTTEGFEYLATILECEI